LISRWQISAGEISEWLPPLLYAAAILVSAWVLSDARRRKLPSYAVAAWTLATLIAPHIVLPLYLIARIFTRTPDATPQTLEASTSPAGTKTGDAQADDSTTHAQISNDTEEQVAAAESPEDIRAPRWRRRKLALPLLYALALLSIAAIYFYRDYHSFDAHLARAANARLLNQRAATIREYRAALRLSDDAHTHKLLAVQLAEDGQLEAALAEFRAAARRGEPDELLPLHTAHMLNALGRTAEARLEYQKFLREDLCTRPAPDARCQEAAARAEQIQNGLIN
jgi:tetratricopeptide (TPR) repeat protein